MARNKYPEITEQRILDSAYRLFLEKGWNATTIQDIIDDLGDLTRGAFYHHFKSKEDIIDAVTKRMFINNNPFDRAELDHKLDGYGKLRKVLILSLTNEDNIQLAKKIPPSVRESPQIISKQVQECKTIIAPYFQKLIEDGNNDGSLEVEHPKQVAESLCYLMQLWVSPQFVNKDETEFAAVIDTFAKALEGLGLPIIDDEIKHLCIQVYKDNQ